MTRFERAAPCKVNLLLNILGKRPDGFHELETIMHPVALEDTLEFEPISADAIRLSCDNPELPVTPENLVWRAAAAFRERARLAQGVSIHLQKRVPLAAGLGGGSSDAACTLLSLNELFGRPLSFDVLVSIAGTLGSDVPFFLQRQPALAIGRGERVQPLQRFAALQGAWILLIHPGFGVSTAWAYQSLAGFPEALNGRKGRADELVARLRGTNLSDAGSHLYNSLEAPVLCKYPILGLYQEFLRNHGAAGTLMSGSGSTTFALIENQSAAEDLQARFLRHFGESSWTKIVPI